MFIFTISVFNCEKNNLDVPSEDTIKILHSKGTTIDYLSNEQIPEVINTITSITGKETLSKSLQMKGVVYNKAYIDFNKVLKVKSEDDIVNYTFNVYLENSPLNEFYNLIVTEDAQGVISKPYVIKYVLDSDAVEVYLANNRDFNYFKGKRHIMSFDDFFGNLDFNLGKSSVVLRCSEDEKPIDNTYSDDNDGDFYAIPSGNILQTNSGGYTYAQSQTPIAWHSHRLSLSTYNINTNQYFNSYAATVTNPVSTITAGGVQLTINTNISSQTISTAPSIISVQVTAYTTVTSSGGSSDGGPTGATFTGYTEITYKYSNGDTVVKIINTTSSKQSVIKGVDCPEASQGIIGLSDDSIEENISHMLKLSRYNNEEAWVWLNKKGHPGVSTFKLLPLYNFLAENTNENGVVSAEAVEFGLLAIEAMDNDGVNDGEVDFEDNVILDSTFINNEKAKCIYDKLKESPKFKNLFIDTFGEDKNLNVTFKVSDNIAVNGKCVPGQIFINPVNGQITSANIEILINKDILGSNSAISVAKTILHESIHAYLMVKRYGCDQGTPFEELGDVELSELLNEYFLECEPIEDQHEFMFNFMIPTMSGILADIKDDLIPLVHQQNAEAIMFIDESNPLKNEFGEYVKDVPWDWNEFYKYLSMAGLQNSSAFHLELGDINNITPKYINYDNYANEYGTRSFDKNCSE